jgi:hypothetical protein
MIEFTFLLPLGNAFKKLNQQFITKGKTARLFEDDTGSYAFKNYDPQSIAGDFDIVSVNPRYEAEGSKEARRQQLLDMFNSFANNPTTNQYINVPKFLEEILGSYDIKDYKNHIQAPPPPQPQETPEPLPAMPSESVSYRDLPIAGKIQLAAKAGIQLTPDDFANEPAIGQPVGSTPTPTPTPEQPVQEAEQPVNPDVNADPNMEKLAEMIANLPPEEQAAAIQKFDQMGAK